MKRLMRIAAAAVLAGTLASGGPAAADGRGHGDGHGRWSRGEDAPEGGEWRGPPPGYRGPPRYREDPREYRGYREDREYREDRGGGWGYGPPAAYGYPGPPPYVQRRGPPGSALRRGGLMPPEYRGAVVPDYGRHRLRPPPPGFAWVRMGDRFMLVSRSTGQIFDVVGD